MPKSILPRRSFLKSAGALGAMAAGSLSGADAAIAGGLSASQNAANDLIQACMYASICRFRLAISCELFLYYYNNC